MVAFPASANEQQQPATQQKQQKMAPMGKEIVLGFENFDQTFGDKEKTRLDLPSAGGDQLQPEPAIVKKIAGKEGMRLNDKIIDFFYFSYGSQGFGR